MTPYNTLIYFNEETQSLIQKRILRHGMQHHPGKGYELIADTNNVAAEPFCNLIEAKKLNNWKFSAMQIIQEWRYFTYIACHLHHSIIEYKESLPTPAFERVKQEAIRINVPAFVKDPDELFPDMRTEPSHANKMS